MPVREFAKGAFVVAHTEDMRRLHSAADALDDGIAKVFPVIRGLSIESRTGVDLWRGTLLENVELLRSFQELLNERVAQIEEVLGTSRIKGGR